MSIQKILILGMGGMGIRHLNAFSKISCCQVSCFDTRKHALKNLNKKNLDVQYFSNLAEIDPNNYAGVIIATPTDTHLYYTRWCINQNLPFLVEKPLSTNVINVPQFVKESQDKNLKCGVAFPRRYSNAIQKIRNQLQQGKIGNLKMINCKFSQDFRKYRPDYKNTYYAKLISGGGVIMDALSHHVNLACYFGGAIQKVQSFYDKFEFEDVECEDSAIINVRFKNGIIGTIQGNQFQKPNEDSIELIGTEGNIKYDRITEALELQVDDSGDSKQEIINGDWDIIIDNQALEFIDCITEKNVFPRTTLAEGLHHLKVVLAARESQLKNKIITVIE